MVVAPSGWISTRFHRVPEAHEDLSVKPRTGCPDAGESWTEFPFLTIPRRPARSQWPPVGPQGSSLGKGLLGVSARCLGRVRRGGRARLGSRTFSASGRGRRRHRLHGRRGTEERQYHLAPAS